MRQYFNHAPRGAERFCDRSEQKQNDNAGKKTTHEKPLALVRQKLNHHFQRGESLMRSPQKSIDSALSHHPRLVDTVVIACKHPAVTENNFIG
jgi:hypothetical protein